MSNKTSVFCWACVFIFTLHCAERPTQRRELVGTWRATSRSLDVVGMVVRDAKQHPSIEFTEESFYAYRVPEVLVSFQGKTLKAISGSGTWHLEDSDHGQVALLRFTNLEGRAIDNGIASFDVHRLSAGLELSCALYDPDDSRILDFERVKR